jgi:hypothetical protein
VARATGFSLMLTGAEKNGNEAWAGAS